MVNANIIITNKIELCADSGVGRRLLTLIVPHFIIRLIYLKLAVSCPAKAICQADSKSQFMLDSAWYQGHRGTHDTDTSYRMLERVCHNSGLMQDPGLPYCVVNLKAWHSAGCNTGIAEDFNRVTFPIVSVGGACVQCVYCHSSHMRFSRFRLSDLPRLLLLQVPVRCYSCEERVYASIFSAWNMRSAREKARKRRGQEQPKQSGAESDTRHDRLTHKL